MATQSKRVAEGIGRRPGVVCGVSTLITLLVSVLALVVGEFTVSADNDGWQSRTTELANRQMQLEAAEGGLDERRWSRPPVASRRKLHTSNESNAAQLLAAKPKAARVIKRRLLESDPPDSEVSECWNGHAEWNDPLVVYRAKDAATDLLSPAAFQQVLASPSALPLPLPVTSPSALPLPLPLPLPSTSALPLPQTTRTSTSSGVRARGARTRGARVQRGVPRARGERLHARQRRRVPGAVERDLASALGHAGRSATTLALTPTLTLTLTPTLTLALTLALTLTLTLTPTLALTHPKGGA